MDHIIDSAYYYMHAPKLTREAIDAVWQNYFVEMSRLDLLSAAGARISHA